MTTEPAEPAEPTPSPAPAPPPAAPPSPTFSKPVLVAGLLGGLLGAVFSFALGRVLPAPVKPPPPAPPSEARQFTEHVLGKWKDGKNDEFMSLVRPAFAEASDEQFAEVRKGMYEAREHDVKLFGGSGEFEFCRESILSPTLVRLTYLEKYPRGCVVWSLTVYNAPSGWLVASCELRRPGQAVGAPLQ
jgi:hypothetical protein